MAGKYCTSEPGPDFCWSVQQSMVQDTPVAARIRCQRMLLHSTLTPCQSFETLCRVRRIKSVLHYRYVKAQWRECHFFNNSENEQNLLRSKAVENELCSSLTDCLSLSPNDFAFFSLQPDANGTIYNLHLSHLLLANTPSGAVSTLKTGEKYCQTVSLTKSVSNNFVQLFLSGHCLVLLFTVVTLTLNYKHNQFLPSDW